MRRTVRFQILVYLFKGRETKLKTMYAMYILIMLSHFQAWVIFTSVFRVAGVVSVQFYLLWSMRLTCQSINKCNQIQQSSQHLTPSEYTSTWDFRLSRKKSVQFPFFFSKICRNFAVVIYQASLISPFQKSPSGLSKQLGPKMPNFVLLRQKLQQEAEGE